MVYDLYNNISEALHRASFLNFQDIIVSIIDCLSQSIGKDKLQAYINEKTFKGMACLHYASYNGNISAIELLISHGADLSSLTSTGYSMIHLAAIGNQPEAMILFKDKYKLDLHQLDLKSNSALHLAAFNKSTLTVNFLLSWKFQINAQNSDGYTPLHLAIMVQSEKMIKKLLHNGANRDIKDKYDRTAFDFALNTTNAAIYSIVRKKTFFERLCCIPEIRKHQYNIGDVLSFLLLYFFLVSIVIIDLLPVLNNEVYLILFIALLFIICGLYLVTSCCNTGTKEKLELRPLLTMIEQGDDFGSFCPFCMNHKTKTTKHCVICNKCIEGFDHHCFFFVNCIGKRNLLLFFAFIITVNVFLILCIVIIIKCFLTQNEDLAYDSSRIPFMIEGADWLYYSKTKIIFCSITLPFYVIIEGILLLFFVWKFKNWLIG